jgi:hypothetical protein
MNGDLDDFRLSEPDRLPPPTGKLRADDLTHDDFITPEARKDLIVNLQDAWTMVLILAHRLEIVATEATPEEVLAVRGRHPLIVKLGGGMRLAITGPMGS